MTYLEAAYKILSATKGPLHYQRIAELALEQGLITPTGLTPDATMGSRLYTDTKQEGSQFVARRSGHVRSCKTTASGYRCGSEKAQCIHTISA